MTRTISLATSTESLFDFFPILSPQQKMQDFAEFWIYVLVCYKKIRLDFFQNILPYGLAEIKGGKIFLAWAFMTIL
ncbi:hypothetical protein PV328_008427 [Microctonus aethiopoides]|uniref:Uncharacterized protein n=1 Tax=Microctonus aethiopoides TaxID=144406 RepID=A0AA39KQX8_9HYME|nr:hypothetical protein PV328_008427 [Microctonus aethiopoides]